MKGLDPEALKDPKGSAQTLVGVPTANNYAYVVKNEGGTSCDNISGNKCTRYKLTATLSDGTTYVKENL